MPSLEANESEGIGRGIQLQSIREDQNPYMYAIVKEHGNAERKNDSILKFSRQRIKL